MGDIKVLKKKFDQPDEKREFKGHGHIDVLNFDKVVVGRAIFEPGWKWSSDVKPIAETESCQASHLGYVVKGKMKIKLDGGDEVLLQKGDVFTIPPGHDAWVEGDETCELLDFGGYAEYAVSKEKEKKSA